MVVGLRGDVVDQDRALGAQAAADQAVLARLAPVLQAEAQERVAAHGGGADAAVLVAHDRAQEVAERAVELLDGGLEDRLDVGHAGQPGAERVGEAELARALAQALLALGGVEGHGRRGHRRRRAARGRRGG